LGIGKNGNHILLRNSNKTNNALKKALTPGPSPKGRGEVLLEPLKTSVVYL
jgi:hypothetical protein